MPMTQTDTSRKSHPKLFIFVSSELLTSHSLIPCLLFRNPGQDQNQSLNSLGQLARVCIRGLDSHNLCYPNETMVGRL
jgi:hypothetical protein